MTKVLRSYFNFYDSLYCQGIYVSVTKVLRSYFNIMRRRSGLSFLCFSDQSLTKLLQLKSWVEILMNSLFQWPKSYEATSTYHQEKTSMEKLFQWPKSYEATSTSWKLAFPFIVFSFSDQSLTKLLQQHPSLTTSAPSMFQWPKSYEATSTRWINPFRKEK